jgi:hypothetical protein
LQQFIGACNWVRSTIPNFSEAIAPLQNLLVKYTKEAKSMKGTQLRKYELSWDEEANNCFNKVKRLLSNQVKLSHLDSSQILCLFTDASDYFYGIILTQIPHEDLDLKVSDQRHSPVAFLSGKFSASQLKWSTIEKEAFPVIVAMTKLKHFLLTSKGFRLFTDHRNLVFVFNPVGTKKASTDRLLRWADVITSFRFVVEHIPGSFNVWADILSRWQEKLCEKPVFASMNLSVPTTLNDFEWPSVLEICEAQKSQTNIPAGLEFSEELFRKDGRIWVPTHDLQTRIMIVAHCASSGHRGGETTSQIILKNFWWENIRKDVQEFVMNCLHCTVNAGQVVPRPLSEQMHASERNEIVH